MRYLLLITVASISLATPASASYWNRSGFSLDHNFHSPYDNIFGSRYRRALPNNAPIEVTEEERAKAIRDQRTCAPVIMHTDEGIVRHAAKGCR